MYPIDTALEKKLTESLHLYYESLGSADLKSLRSVMEDESYFTLLEMMSFKHVFHEPSFKSSLEAMQRDALALKKVEDAVSLDLKKRVQDSEIKILRLEHKCSHRITLHYTQNDKLKKMYFSSSEANWKIDSKAGRKL